MAKKLILFTVAFFLAACGRSSGTPASATAELADSLLSPAPSAQCASLMQTRFDQFRAQQAAWYKKHGSPVPAATNQSQLHIGTNGRVIVMLHGFLSSPACMNDLAEGFKKQGYTLVIPLLTGYASDPNAVNASTVDDWKASINTAMSIARVCSTSVSVVAHSLGAALATEEIEDGTLKNLDRVVTMAPYYKTYTEWTKTVVDDLPSSMQSLDIAKVRAWIAPLGIQIPGFQLAPGTEFTLPLVAVRTVVNLQDTLDKFASVLPKVAIMPVVSMEDETIDSSYALAYTEQHFHEVNPIVYPVGDHVYHSLEMRSDNPKFDELAQTLSDYLNESHH